MLPILVGTNIINQIHTKQTAILLGIKIKHNSAVVQRTRLTGTLEVEVGLDIRYRPHK